MPFGRYTCGLQWHIVLDWVPNPRRRDDLGVEVTNRLAAMWSNSQPNMQLQIAAKRSVLCCHLANTNETAIPPFAKLLWSLLLLHTFELGLQYLTYFIGPICIPAKDGWVSKSGHFNCLTGGAFAPPVSQTCPTKSFTKRSSFYNIIKSFKSNHVNVRPSVRRLLTRIDVICGQIFGT